MFDPNSPSMRDAFNPSGFDRLDLRNFVRAPPLAGSGPDIPDSPATPERPSEKPVERPSEKPPVRLPEGPPVTPSAPSDPNAPIRPIDVPPATPPAVPIEPLPPTMA